MGNLENGAGASPDKNPYEAELDEQRQIINGIDAELVPLVRRRAEAALEIGEIKARHGLPVFVGAREQEVINRAIAANGENSIMLAGDVETLMRTVMKTSRAAQQSLTEKETNAITGFRPTSDLTLGNLLGAVLPSLELQDDPDTELYFFVADLHGLTNTDPDQIAEYRYKVVHDLIALGVDPQRSTLYMQADIADSVVEITHRLGPYTTLGKIANSPNIKDKAGVHDEEGRFVRIDDVKLKKLNYALLGYPVLMAADIYAQQAGLVPVGEDQKSHVEISRDIARRFNRTLGEPVLVEPTAIIVGETVQALDGKGKMSKSRPSQAIMLTDDPELASRKISKAATANAGEWNPTIESHFRVAETTAQTDEQHERLREIKQAHFAGESVMRDFKIVWAGINERVLEDFQIRRAEINEADVLSALRYGADRAEKNAHATLRHMQEVMGF
jgi:tryptophanyl-tRNA synthetase